MAKKNRRRGRRSSDLFGGRSVYRDTTTTNVDENGEQTTEEAEKESASTTPSRDDLLQELGILNLSIDTVAVILLATFLNYYYVHSLKAQVLDELYNTNFEENFIDTTNFPKITNSLFLYGTGVFLTLNYTLLQEIKSENINDINNKEVVTALRSFLASLFTFLAVTISRNNLEI